MFGHESRPARVYAWNTLEPTMGEAEAIQAMHARLALWNQLVEIEHDVTGRRNAIAIATEPALAGDDLSRDERRAAWQRLHASPEIALQFAALEAERRERVKTARDGSGLYWCNYDDVLASYRLARPRPGELQFHSWARARGKVCVRWQTGLPVAALFCEDTRAQVDPVPPEAYTDPSRRARLRFARTKIRIRVASDDHHKPVWLELPFPMHRPLPPDGIVRQVAAYRERIGTHYRWSITITVELPQRLVNPSATGQGTIAIDLGWRKLASGIRVAAWRDDAGRAGELVLPRHTVSALVSSENIRSIRDQRFNAVKSEFASWLKANEVPARLREATATLGQWKSAARLAAVAIAWGYNRFPGDQVGYELVEDWRKRDKHLLEYEANQRDQALHERLHHYRQFAAWIARTYAVVRLEKFDLSEVAKRSKTTKGEEQELHQSARHQRFLLAPSVLRLAVENAAKREGLTVEYVNAALTTQTCSVCGGIDRFDAAKELVHTCSWCATSWDQDHNAARNILSQTGGVPEQKSVCDECGDRGGDSTA